MTLVTSLKTIIRWLENGDHVTEAAGELHSTWQMKWILCVWLVMQDFMAVLASSSHCLLSVMAASTCVPLCSVPRAPLLAAQVFISGKGGGGAGRTQRQLWLLWSKTSGVSALFWQMQVSKTHLRIWPDDKDLPLDKFSCHA